MARVGVVGRRAPAFSISLDQGQKMLCFSGSPGVAQKKLT